MEEEVKREIGSRDFSRTIGRAIMVGTGQLECGGKFLRHTHTLTYTYTQGGEEKTKENPNFFRS